MDPSSQNLSLVEFALGLFAAFSAAACATASAAIGSIPPARRAALAESLEGPEKLALERYIERGDTIDSRYLTLRVLGIATAAALLGRIAPESLGVWRIAVGACAALFAFGVPAEIGILAAARAGERVAPKLIFWLRPLELAAAPLALPVVFIGRVVAGLVPRTPKSPDVTETEMEHLANEGEINGSLEADQSEMIRNVLDFGDLTAGDVMIPRAHATTFDVETALDEVLKTVNADGHSRYPVYADNVDNVIGILHVKDLIRYTAVADDLLHVKLADIVRKPVIFVPAGQSASSVLKDMRAGRRQHIAVVIDEFGGVSGIVTLEDLIEEIVGDIRDEHDVEEPPILDIGNGHLMVDASVPIADLSAYLGADLPEDGDYTSLGGFLVAQMHTVPSVGQRFEAFDFEFVVREADERHVSRVEIIRALKPADSIAPSTARGSRNSAA